jgi:hypothetical protein
MATSAQYASTPVFGSATLSTADTSLTAPTTVGTVLTAGASGSPAVVDQQPRLLYSGDVQ